MNFQEAGRKGAYRRWAKVSKRSRTIFMRKVARARWDKVKKGRKSHA